MPVDIPSKVTIPAGLLALASLWLCPWQITLALLFSALGDYMGSVHNFMGQMGFFAVGHIWYIVYFAGRYFRKVETDRKGQGLSCNGNILCSSTSLHRFHENSTGNTGRSRTHRSMHLRIADLHDVGYSNAPAKQPLRARSRTFRILRLHPCMEQIRRACAVPPLSGTRHILPCAVAPFHPLDKVQSRP